MATVLKRCNHARSSWAKCPDSWTVRWWDGSKQRERSFKTDFKAAKKFSAQVEADKANPVTPGPAPVTFGEYAELWLSTSPGTPNTVRIYRSVLQNHLVPVLGDRQLADVAADREGVAVLLRSLSNGTGASAYTVLRAMLSEAERAGRIASTRLGGLRLEPANPRADFTFPTWEQFTALVEGMPEDLRCAIWLMRGCGLRRGEVLGVRAEDFSGGRLRLREQRLHSGAYGPLKARKPGEYRDVPVPAYAAQAVEQHGVESGYLFRCSDVRLAKNFRVAADGAGLTGLRLHDLRHIFASVALSRNVPITDVSRWLGHRSVDTTFRIYGHLLPDSYAKAREALDAEYAEWSAAA